jgi:hypothetical protein
VRLMDKRTFKIHAHEGHWQGDYTFHSHG